jgi:YVTN family beta-propeller protein
MARRNGGLARWIGLVVVLAGRAVAADEPTRPEVTLPGLTTAGKVLLPNGWSLKPAGSQTVLGDFPVAIALNPAEPVLAILHAGYGTHEVVTVGANDGKVIARVTLKETFAGLVWSRDGTRLFVGGGFDDVIRRFDHARGLLSNETTFSYPTKADSARVPAGLALEDDGSLWVANAFGHSVAKFDAGGKVAKETPLEKDSYPYGVALDAPRGKLYVSLWNRAEVLAIDVKSGAVVGRWPAQEHPNEMLLTPSGKRLYVANANRNTVTVVDLEANRPIETIGTAIDPNAPAGSMPSALALTEDESVLFVANAATNDLAVVNVKEPGASKPLGFIPTGWFPTSVRLSKDGKTLYVTNGKGTTSRANRDGPNPLLRGGEGGTRAYIAGLFQGTLARIPLPGPSEMVAHTKTVYECSPLRSRKPEDRPAGHPIPAKVGEPSPITHVVYIIKENRTYDQVLGDMAEGNGDRSICLFGEAVTPNHHALAREFVLLDNFYVDGEVSADGHEWSMGAFATDYVEKTWPLSYRGDRRVPYPSEGALAIARPAGGYLWDRAAAKGVTYRSYGEFVYNAAPGLPAGTNVAALKGHFDPKFHGYDLDYPDARRADRFLEEVAEFEQKGEMPRLSILRLPNDHTSGTRPGKLTPTAMVADNDLAFGKVVEGLSRSKFWPHLAIFVVEDDAQNGPDHVDAHRTIAYAISPYIKRHSVDSTMYSTSSMLRTIELILGLDPMSQFDASARPMANAFAATPDLTPYAQKPARVDVNAKNARTAPGAEASLKLDLDEAEDRADDIVFNEIIWKSVKGADSPMPPPVRSAFVLPRSDRRARD